MGGGYWSSDWGKPRPARRVEGGIRAQSKAGGESWWARRWLQVLEDIGLDARIARGRSYARQGQVISIDIKPGEVLARVQGSRHKPYQVVINLPVLAEADQSKLLRTLGRQAAFVASLLAGQMPQEIEELALGLGLSFFPEHVDDLGSKCSCPDPSSTCKHIAAVYYLLAEEFDRDPFLLFRLRGLDREAMFRSLEGLGAAPAREPDEPARRDLSEPIPPDLNTFWEGALDAAEPPGSPIVAAANAAALPRRLGPFPFWRGDEPLQDQLDPIYTGASEHAIEALTRTGEELHVDPAQASPGRKSRPGVKSRPAR